jgi:hypothetical protein
MNDAGPRRPKTAIRLDQWRPNFCSSTHNAVPPSDRLSFTEDGTHELAKSIVEALGELEIIVNA